jgi:hypothetical protein
MLNAAEKGPAGALAGRKNSLAERTELRGRDTVLSGEEDMLSRGAMTYGLANAQRRFRFFSAAFSPTKKPRSRQ